MIKSGVRLHGIRPELAIAYIIAVQIFTRHGVDAVITSCIDGKHSIGSLHYAGCALDLRSRDIPEAKRPVVKAELAAALGDDFDVVLEKNHFHIELQPKQPYGV